MNAWRLMGAIGPVVALAACHRETTTSLVQAMENIETRRPEVTAVAAVAREFHEIVRGTGTLTPRRDALIRPEVDARITAMPFDIGDVVASGEVLVELDPVDSELALTQAQAALETSRAQLANLLAWRRDEEIAAAQAAVDRARSIRELAQREIERQRELFGEGVISQQEIDGRQQAVDAAEASLHEAESQLELAQAGPTPEQVSVSQAAVDQAQAAVAVAERNLQQTRIRAPFDGVLVERLAEVGERVNTMSPMDLLRFADLSTLEAEVELPERFAGLVHTGQEAEVVIGATNQTLRGTVTAVNRRIDPATRSFLTKVAVSNEALAVSAGHFATVSLTVSHEGESVAIPRDAVVLREGQPTVFVLSGSSVEERSVRVGVEEDGLLQVIEGVQPGESVVTQGALTLRTGQQVAVADAPPSNVVASGAN